MAKKSYRVLRGTYTRGKPGHEENFTPDSPPFEADENEVARHVANGDLCEVAAARAESTETNNAYGLPKSLRVEGDLDADVPLGDGENAPKVAFGFVVARAWKDFGGKVADFNKADQDALLDAALDALREEKGG